MTKRAAEEQRGDLYPLFRYLDVLKQSENDQRLILLVAHGVVELFVNSVVDVTCRNGRRITSGSRGYPHAVKLVILNELGVLNDRQLTLYDWFRKLRNRAAHEPLFAIGQMTCPSSSRSTETRINSPASVSCWSLECGI